MAKRPSAVDPLEDAKILRPAPTQVAAPPSNPVPPPVPAPVQGAPGRYRVKLATTVSICGQLVNLPADSIVSADIYGPKGFACILDSNIPLEKL